MENIILIGMPGCGKSTIGVVLAKAMGYKFLDTDLLMQEREKRLLSEIIDEDGPDRFNQIENEVIQFIHVEKTVIATGGSVVYGKEAMEHLRKIGVVIYIRMPYNKIRDRLGDITKRGISIKEGETLNDLYNERTPLYEKYAHIIIDVEEKEIKDAMQLIKEKYEGYLLLEELG